MIYLLTTAAHQYTIRSHFRSYGAALKRLIRPWSYEQLFRARRLPAGTYIFSDIERLWPDDAERAAEFWQAMHGRDGFRLLNHPTRSMRRYELLRTLHHRGINRFNVYRLTDLRSPERFPVYLRGENDHNANRTPLLNGPEELAAAIRAADEAGRSRENTIIAEFCDTADAAGIYRKYAAFCVAGRIIPRHLSFSQYWVVKQPDLVEPELLEAEREYLATNPHEEQLREIFRHARIDYGRIDYGILGDRIQVWEINTNPTICSRHVAQRAFREPLQGQFAARLQEAFVELDNEAPAGMTLRIDPRDPTGTRGLPTWTQRVHRLWTRFRAA